MWFSQLSLDTDTKESLPTKLFLVNLVHLMHENMEGNVGQ